MENKQKNVKKEADKNHTNLTSIVCFINFLSDGINKLYLSSQQTH